MIKLMTMVAALATTAICVFLPSNVAAMSSVDNCYAEAIQSADDNVTVREIKERCAGENADGIGDPKMDSRPAYEESALDERIAASERVEARPYVLTPHKPNYLLVSYMREPNQAPFVSGTGISDPLKNTELKLQFSVKAPIWRNMFGSETDMYFAFSSVAWWQALNLDLSAPFRETNYEPELFLRSVTDYNFLGMTIAGWQLGLNHESNGKSEPLSRSWNRVMGRANIELHNDLAMQFRAWYRIPESSKVDNNPDIHRYLGYGDVRAVWTPNKNTITAMVRPSPEKTNFEITWSYPISQVFRVYAQYYNGYGESLIDYNYDMERIGIGFALNDYLMRH